MPGTKHLHFGKWHASIPEPPSSGGNGLEPYGFDFNTYPDPTGSNLQGTYGQEPYYHNDAYTVDQATGWLDGRSPSDEPWCLTVSLVNPHDREFFPAGTESKTVHDDFLNTQINPNLYPQQTDYTVKGPQVPWDENKLKSPRSYGYPAVPPNWESQQDLVNNNKPKTQTFIKEFSQLIWGGIGEEPSQETPTVEPYPKNSLGKGVIKMPYSYWRRGLDSYTQIMEIVDGQIGRVLDKLNSLPSSILENTVIVFAADHGEYSGAHGLVQGKLGPVYEEAWHIPLIVVDPSHRFTGDIGNIRNGLASSVDLSTLLVSIGNNGTRDWMTGNLAEIYGDRHDMISMLKSKDAPGRSYVLYATDEIAPNYFNFNRSPTHILGLRTEETKLGVYADWFPLTTQIAQGTEELEFYDHTTTRGALELANTADSDSCASNMLNTLLNELLSSELQARLPGVLGLQQERAKIGHLIYRDLIAHYPSGDWRNKNALYNILGYGAEF